MAPPSISNIRLHAQNASQTPPAISYTPPETREVPTFLPGRTEPHLSQDLSIRVPIFWRNPIDCGSPPGEAIDDSAAGLFDAAIALAENTWHEAARELGIDSTLASHDGEPSDLPPSDENILETYRMLEKIPDSERELVWTRLMERLRAEGEPEIPESCESYAGFREALSSLGENFPMRVRSLRNAIALIRNHERLGLEPVERPIALAVVAASDHNGALGVSGGFPLMDTLEESGHFHVLYVEADDESDVVRAMEEVYALTGRRIHTLVLGGHGTPTALALGGQDLALGVPAESYDEAHYLDTADFYRGEFSGFDALMETNGQVLLWSCSTGSGGEESPFNLANSVSRAAPRRRIYSMMEPGNIRSLDVAEDGSLELEWNNDAPYVALSPDGAMPELPPRDTTGQNLSHG